MENTVVRTTVGVNSLKAQKVPIVYGVSHQKIHLTHVAEHTTNVVEHLAVEAQVAINAFCLALMQSIAKIQNAG